LHHRRKIPCQQGAVHRWLKLAVRGGSRARPVYLQPRTSEWECRKNASITTGLPSGSDVTEAVEERGVLTHSGRT
jgi:hypothetical protein